MGTAPPRDQPGLRKRHPPRHRAPPGQAPLLAHRHPPRSPANLPRRPPRGRPRVGVGRRGPPRTLRRATARPVRGPVVRPSRRRRSSAFGAQSCRPRCYDGRPRGGRRALRSPGHHPRLQKQQAPLPTPCPARPAKNRRFRPRRSVALRPGRLSRKAGTATRGRPPRNRRTLVPVVEAPRAPHPRDPSSKYLEAHRTSSGQSSPPAPRRARRHRPTVEKRAGRSRIG